MTNDELKYIIKFVEQVPVGDKRQKVLALLKTELSRTKLQVPKVPRLFQKYTIEHYEHTIV
jgi:hypothetical protein